MKTAFIKTEQKSKLKLLKQDLSIQLVAPKTAAPKSL